MWFSPVPATGVFELHVCCKPGWEGRWLQKSVIKAGFRALETLQAKYVIAIHADPNFKRALSRLGFTLGDNVHVIDMKELEHGKNCGKHLWRTRSA